MGKFILKHKRPILIILIIFAVITGIKIMMGFYFPINREDWSFHSYEQLAKEYPNNEYYKEKLRNNCGGQLVGYKGNEKTVVVPKYIDGKKVDIIDDWAFDYAVDKVETIIIPEGVKEIRKMAFHSCTSLKTIYIPLSVETIYKNSLNFGSSERVNVITLNHKVLAILKEKRG